MPHKLLLADDSVTIQRVIELTFADEDVHVVAVGDGKKAIESIESERPDIVLADVGMPERDGYDVAEFIKRNPQLARKLAKPSARRHLLCLPSDNEATRIMRTCFQRSRRGNRALGSSYPRSPVSTVTSCPRAAS